MTPQQRSSFKIVETLILLQKCGNEYLDCDGNVLTHQFAADQCCGVFKIMRQEVCIVKVINFNNLAMMYKVIKWFMLMSAPVLWIRLLIMTKKGREILYWWYPSVSRAAYIINKRNL